MNTFVCHCYCFDANAPFLRYIFRIGWSSMYFVRATIVCAHISWFWGTHSPPEDVLYTSEYGYPPCLTLPEPTLNPQSPSHHPKTNHCTHLCPLLWWHFHQQEIRGHPKVGNPPDKSPIPHPITWWRLVISLNGSISHSFYVNEYIAMEQPNNQPAWWCWIKGWWVQSSVINNSDSNSQSSNSM